jgi:hypothetical protein
LELVGLTQPCKNEKGKFEKCKTNEQHLNLERSAGEEKAPGARVQEAAK